MKKRWLCRHKFQRLYQDVPLVWGLIYTFCFLHTIAPGEPAKKQKRNHGLNSGAGGDWRLNEWMFRSKICVYFVLLTAYPRREHKWKRKERFCVVYLTMLSVFMQRRNGIIHEELERI
jgi:hypothetical protein